MKTLAAEMKTLKIGDRVAYTARFIKTFCGNIGGKEKGTIVNIGGTNNDIVFIKWDNEEQRLTPFTDDPEYCNEVRKNGMMVASKNICKLKSVSFSDSTV